MARDNLRLFGRTIGTFDAWDGDGYEWMVFYAFKPCDVLANELPEGDLNMNIETGEFTYYEGEKVSKTFDMLPILNMVQKDN